MKKSFKIGQSNEIIDNEKVYDLHNCYDVSGITLLSSDLLKIRFDPNSEWGTDCKTVALNFTDVDYLSFLFVPGDRQSVDIHEMGYKNPDDMDDSWLLAEEQSLPQDHLFFRFGGGNYIRIHSKAVVFNEEYMKASG